MLAVVRFVCNNCHVNAAQRVLKRVNKLTLFFIPTFPVSTKYLVECTNCGATTLISQQQADDYVRAPQVRFTTEATLPPATTAPFEQVPD
jgi:hypothetical protein